MISFCDKIPLILPAGIVVDHFLQDNEIFALVSHEIRKDMN